MCIAIPSRVAKVDGNIAKVDLRDGTFTDINVSLVDVKEGEYVIIQNGFAIEVLNEDEAQESLQIWQKILQDNDADE